MTTDNQIVAWPHSVHLLVTECPQHYCTHVSYEGVRTRQPLPRDHYQVICGMHRVSADRELPAGECLAADIRAAITKWMESGDGFAHRGVPGWRKRAGVIGAFTIWMHPTHFVKATPTTNTGFSGWVDQHTPEGRVRSSICRFPDTKDFGMSNDFDTRTLAGDEFDAQVNGFLDWAAEEIAAKLQHHFKK